MGIVQTRKSRRIRKGWRSSSLKLTAFNKKYHFTYLEYSSELKTQ